MASHTNAMLLCPINSLLESCTSWNNTGFLHDTSPELPSACSLVTSRLLQPQPSYGDNVLSSLVCPEKPLLHLLRLLGLIFLNQFSFLLPFQLPATLTQGHPKGERKKSAWNVHWDLIHILYQFPDHKTPYWQRECSVIMPKIVPFTLCWNKAHLECTF